MWRAILKTTLIAGTLDIIAACLQAYLVKETMPAVVLKFIASGVYGKTAFEGGYEMMAIGLFFHFVIAFACTVIFFFLYPKLNFLKHSILLNSLLIALSAWTVTTQIIIPASKIQPGVFNLGKALIAAGILFLCIGLPVSWFTKKYYSNKSS
ncbi:MAG: hypothetical protein ABIP79_12950 [Chitinophagaceae bacterium]